MIGGLKDCQTEQGQEGTPVGDGVEVILHFPHIFGRGRSLME
jgi:hypothetical protein